jgi:MFS family permease
MTLVMPSIDRRAELTSPIRRLLLVRALRSVSQGALAVAFALYLLALGWSGTAIGLVLTGGGVATAALALGVGPLSDRIGRRRLLVFNQALAFVTAFGAFLTATPWILVPAAVLGGFGRGANGAAGAFAPAEQAWLAEMTTPASRAWIFALNSAIGFFGMALGALLAVMPAVLTGWLPGPLAYRPLFGLAALVAAIGGFVLARTEERFRQPGAPTGAAEIAAATEASRIENRLLIELIAVNALNGLAVGLTGPLISYWFAVRFGLGPEHIAPVLALTFFATGIAALAGGRLAERVGVVRAVVWSRVVGLVCLIAIPIAPTFLVAAAAYLGRSVFSRATVGLRQALVVGLVRDERQGAAASINTASMQVPQAFGPTIAGSLIEAGRLALPFYLAAGLQGLYLVVFDRVFRSHEPPTRQ